MVYNIYKEVMQYNIAEHCWKCTYTHVHLAPALEIYTLYAYQMHSSQSSVHSIEEFVLCYTDVIFRNKAIY